MLLASTLGPMPVPPSYAGARLSFTPDIDGDPTRAGRTGRNSLRAGAHMPIGTVKWFNEQKGYGFIQPDNGGKDVFVHVRDVEQAGLSHLAEGQKVAFEVEADRRSGKDRAVAIKIPA
jgi:CspA family cold shock protein